MKPALPSQEEMSALVSEIRTRVAFEHMLVAVLLTAGLSAGAALVANAVLLLGQGIISIEALVRVLIGGLTVGFAVFLIGFFAAVVVGAPLFTALEKAKLRKPWPYYCAALAIEFIALWLIFSRFPLDSSTPLAAYAYFLPGLVAAFLFTRSMRPLWRQAALAETNAVSTVVRLH